MKKVFGVLGVLVVVCVLTAVLNPRFLNAENLVRVLQRTSMLGILAIGSAFVIIAGGIDLSIGSVVGLVGCVLALLAGPDWHWPFWAACLAVLALVLAIGLIHGLLITKLNIQPFVVTLCGLLIYRGVARWITSERELGLAQSVRGLATAKIPEGEGFGLPVPFLILVLLAVAAAVVLNLTVYGRYLLAVGRNEQAARYSGINTDAVIVGAYVLCPLLAGAGGILYAMYQTAIQPAGHGESLELFAIAAAVLGGCSLRGGEGSILGVVLGSALLTVLYNAASLLRMQNSIEPFIAGVVILVGVVLDEVVKRVAAARRRRRAAA